MIRSDLAELGASATLAINERTEALTKAGKKVYRLGFGASPFPVPPLVVEALQQHATEKAYLPVQGLESLREAVAEHHRRLDGLDAHAEEVLIGPGSKELLFLLQLVFEGQTLIPSPSWVSYAPQVKLLGGTPTLLKTHFEDGFKVTPEALDNACTGSGARIQDRLLILNYPQNPVGNTYSADELSALAEVARRHRLLILADEIYGRLHYAGHHVSLARFYPEATLVSSGLSKWCGAGGWRLGTLLVPKQLEKLRRVMAAAASETFTSVTSPVQYAAITAFEGSAEIERYLQGSRKILGALGAECHRRLRQAGLRVHRPEGGFYLFPDFSPCAEILKARGLETSPDLASRLLEEAGVATLPGVPFGRPADDLTLRLCFVDFDGSRALRELQDHEEDLQSQRFLEHVCSPVLEGIDRLAAWLRPPG